MKVHFLKGIWKDIIILENNREFAFIDTGYEDDYEQIREYLNNLGVKDIAFILLTHFHRDHYGCIPFLVKNYNVSKVYFKNYSGLDKTTATGVEADDEYRENEKIKCENMKETIREYSNLIEVENIDTIKFGEVEIKLFNNSNSIKEIYEDVSCKECYHNYMFNENQNSLALFMKVNERNIYFGGDVLDKESFHPKASYVNKNIVSVINEEIDVYKVAHHGANYSNSLDTLNIIKPKIAIISNQEEVLKTRDIIKDLKKVNSNVKILLTDRNNVIVNIDEKGNISYEETKL